MTYDFFTKKRLFCVFSKANKSNSSSINNLQNIFERIFETKIQSKFEELNAKDSSSLSRELVTVVLDDSIFK
jgi:hypothetical protein